MKRAADCEWPAPIRTVHGEREAHRMTYAPFGFGVPAVAAPAGTAATAMGTLVIGLLLLAALVIVLGTWSTS
jgi:hypothetical protein